MESEAANRQQQLSPVGDVRPATIIRALVSDIHSSPSQIIVYLAGGASQFCSQHTAGEMALLAYNRAIKLARLDSQVVGAGFTGSLTGMRPKHGEHRFHISTRTSDRSWFSVVTLSKAIANACRIPTALHAKLTEVDISNEPQETFSEDEELEQLINGQICFKEHFGNESPTLDADRKIILSGSFNPLHEVRPKLLEVATSIYGGCSLCFELAAINADKPPLSVEEIKNRVKQFEKYGKTDIISNQPFFYKKAELFPGSAFVIGADTAVRLINLKYFHGDYNKMLQTLMSCKSTGCTFLLGDLMLMESPRSLRISTSRKLVDTFRMDISSIDIKSMDYPKA